MWGTQLKKKWASLCSSGSDRSPVSLSSHRCFSLSCGTTVPHPQLAAIPESQDPPVSHTFRWGDRSHQPLYTGGNHWEQRLTRWQMHSAHEEVGRNWPAMKNPLCKGPEGSSSEGLRLETPLTLPSSQSTWVTRRFHSSMPSSFRCLAQPVLSEMEKWSLKQMNWLGQGLTENQWHAMRGVTCTHLPDLSPRGTSSLKPFLIAWSLISSDPCLCVPHSTLSCPLPAPDLPVSGKFQVNHGWPSTRVSI